MKKIKNPYIGLEQQGYNCFACCPTNPYGLKMEFYEDGDDIVSIWNPGDNYQGWLRTLHGGIQATLIDELGAWVISRKLQTSGVTTNLQVKYRNPIPTGDGVQIEIRGHIKEMKRNFAFIDVTISHDGKVCTMAGLTYFCFTKEKAASDYYFTGCELEEE